MYFFSSRQYDIYCSVKYCCSNSSIMKSIETPNHPGYHWSTLWPLEVWVGGQYNSRWFCVHKLSMFIYLSMVSGYGHHRLKRGHPGHKIFKTRFNFVGKNLSYFVVSKKKFEDFPVFIPGRILKLCEYKVVISVCLFHCLNGREKLTKPWTYLPQILSTSVELRKYSYPGLKIKSWVGLLYKKNSGRIPKLV